MPFVAPGRHFLLGTDEVGRDIFSRVLYGLRTSWFASLVVIASGVLIGGLIGLIAGTSGGWIDNLLMRITDIFLALPGPILAIAVVAALGPSLQHTLIAVAIVWWPFYARIVRGEVKALAARPHVEAARLAGVGQDAHLAVRHLLPGAIPATMVTASLDVGNLVLTLAGLVVPRPRRAGPRARARRHGRPRPALPARAVVGADHARPGRARSSPWWPTWPATACAT